MIPIAVAKGSGAEWKNGLAWVLIGGLNSSMFITILFVPFAYSIVDYLKDLISGDRKKKNQVEQDFLD
jgi:HAE1 family hydrophobic/amphiphilic exporter-1